MENIAALGVATSLNESEESISTEPVLFIIPHKIQKRRLEDMKTSGKRKGFLIVESVGPQVTHIIAECETLEQAKKILPKTNGNEISDNVLFLSLNWFIECLKSSAIIKVQEYHKLKMVGESVPTKMKEDERRATEMAEWACQRIAKLNHSNKKFTTALEILEEHAMLRDGAQDYSRALAFRRASCVLKSLKFELKDISQLDGMKDIGDHVRRVLVDILDHGASDEVDEIATSSWFKTMKLFTGIFGVGSATAKKWIDQGLNYIEDVKHAKSLTSDWRVKWGLAFYSELTSPVHRQEAFSFLEVVKMEAEKILPGIIVQLCGGFRRGKPMGHDVDILLSHPNEGAELGLLPKLLEAMQEKGLILIGHKEKGNFRPEVLYQDFKLSMRGQLDHFEKWLGICKFPKSYQNNQSSVPTSKEKTCIVNSSNSPSVPRITDTIANNCADAQSSIKKTGVTNSLDESLDEAKYEPSVKKSRVECDKMEDPEVLASSDRDWLARRVDLIVAPYSQFYYALVGWTGSKHFNRDARLYAQKVLGLKLTSHGLYDLYKHVSIPATSEKEVFDHLKLPYRDPEERNC